jgi:hypothetical protein
MKQIKGNKTPKLRVSVMHFVQRPHKTFYKLAMKRSADIKLPRFKWSVGHKKFNQDTRQNILCCSVDDPLAVFDKIYDKPWTRLGPYLVGMIVGWILYKTDCKIKMSKVYVFLSLCGWCSCSAYQGRKQLRWHDSALDIFLYAFRWTENFRSFLH